MAHPNPIVASHRSPVPYLGGTGLILAFAGLSILRWAADGSEPGAGQVLLVTSAVAMTGVGTWDDLKALAPARKVVLEAAASLPFAVWGAQGSVARLVLWMAVLLVLVNA